MRKLVSSARVASKQNGRGSSKKHKISKWAVSIDIWNMKEFFSVCVLLLTFAYSNLTTTSPPSLSSQCRVWSNISNTLNREETFRVNCVRKDVCDGFACGGFYVYTGPFASFLPVRLKLCFGVDMKHCENPPGADLHLNLPDYGIHFDQRIHDNETVEVPGLGIDKAVGHIQGILSVVLKHVPGKQAILLSVTFRIRVTAFGVSSFPSSLTKNIVPLIEIPVPPCPPGDTQPDPVTNMSTATCTRMLSDETTTTTVLPTQGLSTTPPLYTDHKFVKPTTGGRTKGSSHHDQHRHPTKAPSSSSTKDKGKKGGKGTYGQKCEPSLHNCENGQICRNKICDCITGLKFDGQSCGGLIFPTRIPDKSTTTSPSGITNPPGPTSAGQTGQKPNTNIIIGAVVGPVSFILLLVIGAGIFYWYRKRDNPYAGRELLLTSGDDDAGM